MAAKRIHLHISFFFVIISLALVQGEEYYNIIDLGAKADGVTDSNKALESAWEKACASTQPATIYVPGGGSYLVGETTFSGPCKSDRISIQLKGAVLLAPSDYTAHGSSGNWLLFQDVRGVSVYGGTLDGRGTALWACKALPSNASCPDGAASLRLNNGQDMMISGLTSVNSQLYHIVIDGCTNAMVEGANITAPGNSPNTDGIHVQRSTGVTITRTTIMTGDDCISIGAATTNLRIDNIACGPGHGISIGSLGKGLNEAGVQNVIVESIVFSGTQNGVRIKTWGRPSKGFVEGVIFHQANMTNVQNPIVIDQNYCPHNKSCPGQNSGVRISNVTYSNIQGSSATEIAVKFDCSPTHSCTGIRLQDVNLTYENRPAQSFCKNAHGTATGYVVPPSCLEPVKIP